MKNKNLLFTISLLLTLLFTSCIDDNTQLYNKVLGGNHELRKFNVKTTKSESTSGWYFVVMGGYSKNSTESTTVRFYFLNNNNEYQLMEKPLNKVNIKIDSTVTTPYVKFYWEKSDNRDSTMINYMYEYDITRVVIYCQEKDFQPEININSLK